MCPERSQHIQQNNNNNLSFLALSNLPITEPLTIEYLKQNLHLIILTPMNTISRYPGTVKFKVFAYTTKANPSASDVMNSNS